MSGDVGSFVGAQMVGGPDAVPFSWLKLGEAFAFPHDRARRLVKLSASRYRDPEGKTWQTGRHVAVVRVP